MTRSTVWLLRRDRGVQEREIPADVQGCCCPWPPLPFAFEGGLPPPTPVPVVMITTTTETSRPYDVNLYNGAVTRDDPHDGAARLPESATHPG